MSDALRVGLVGCGRLAEAGYVPAVAAVAGVSIVAVADVDAVRRTRVAAAAGGAAGFASAAELLADTALDGVIIATPAAAHVVDAEAAANAGVPALVEKPPATDAAGARRLAALDPAPWIAFNRRFDPGARALRRGLAHARLHVRAEISYRRRSWGSHVVRDDALADLGPHLVDWVRWVSGTEVVEVVAADACAERASAELRLDRGTAEIHAVTDRPHAELLEIRNQQGGRVGRHRLGGPVAAVRGRLTGAGAATLLDTITAEVDAFATALRAGAHPDLGTAADGVATMEAIEAIRVSATDRRAVAVHPPTPQGS